jgi:mRNA interferase MazF
LILTLQKATNKKATDLRLSWSHDLVAKYSGMSIVALITTSSRHYPAYIPINYKGTKGQVMLDQTISLDLTYRTHKILAHYDKLGLSFLIETYKSLFSID